MKPIPINIFQILILASALNGIILSTLIFVKKRTGANIYLGLFILLFALGCIKIVLQEKIPYFNYYIPLPLLYQFALGPLLYLYFKKSLTTDYKPLNQLLYFIPSIVFDVLPAIIKFFIGAAYYHEQLQKISFLTDIIAFFFFTYCVIVSWRLVNRYQLQSLSTKISSWLNKTIAASALICITWFLYILMVLNLKGNWIFGIMPYYPIYILFGLCIYSVGIAGYFRPEIGLLVIPVVERKVLLSKEAVTAKTEYIMELLQKNTYYYDENLTLSKLSVLLNIPLNELSYIINTGFNMNFNDFINDYRIKAFKERLKDPENTKYNFIGLAYEVGFSSKASFYRAFKKSTNQTPGEFYKANHIK